MTNNRSRGLNDDGSRALRALAKLMPLLSSHLPLATMVAIIRRSFGASVAWIVIDNNGTRQISDGETGSCSLEQAQRLIDDPRLSRYPRSDSVIVWSKTFGSRFYTRADGVLASLESAIFSRVRIDNYSASGYLFLGFKKAHRSPMVIKQCITVLAEKLKDYLLYRVEKDNAASEIERIVTQYQTIFAHAPLLMNIFDQNNRCLLWNGECERLFGWTQQEINQHPDPLSLFYPDAEIRKQVEQSISHSPLTDMREWHPHNRQGQELTTLWSNILLPDQTVLSIGLDITARKQAELVLARKATVDDLTQSYNRAEILRLLAQALNDTATTGFVVLMLDIDHFKNINDTLGHLAGDRALRWFCDRIRAVAPDALCGRLGGEEFLILLNPGDRKQACAFDSALRQALQNVPLLFDGQPIPLSYSGGILEVTSGGKDVTTVLSQVDGALYQAKRSGRGKSVVASPLVEK